jgi:CarD family transcriptional regulator
MLDKALESAPSAPSPLKFDVSQYVVYPKIGLSVVSAYKELEVAGMGISSIEIRPWQELGVAIITPLAKLPTSNIRVPATAAEFKQVFELIMSHGRQSSAPWHIRSKDMEARMAGTNLLDIASVVRDTLGKSKDKRYSKQTIGSDIPKDATMSYSERQLMEAALKFLSREMSLVTGVAEKQVKVQLISAALKPDYKIDESMFVDACPTHMPPAKFKELFGVTISAAKNTKGIRQEIVLPEAPPVVSYRPRNEPETVNMDPSLRVSRSNMRVAPKLGRSTGGRISVRTAAKVRPEDKAPAGTRDLFLSEEGFVAPKGAQRGYFIKAAQVLAADEFEILSKMSIRRASEQISLATLAAEKEMAQEDIIAIRDRAAEKLKKQYPNLSPKLASFGLFHPYKPAPIKTTVRSVKEKADFEDSLPADKKAAFLAEKNFIAIKGTQRGLFFKAAEILEADEFEILVQNTLRTGKSALTIDEIAVAKKIDRDTVIAIRDRGAAKMRAAYPDLTGKIANYAVFTSYAEYKRRKPQAAAQNKVTIEDTLRPELKEIFVKEAGYVPAKGTQHGIFVKAASILEPDELEILSQTSIRRKEERLSVDTIAAERKISREDIIAIRDRAAGKLKADFVNAGKSYTYFPAFKSYAELTAPKVVEPRTPRVSKTLVSSDLAARIVDGKLMVTISLPLDALKGAEDFKVYLNIGKDEQSEPESISSTGKVGKGQTGRFITEQKIKIDRSPS